MLLTSSQPLPVKLQLKDEKNILIQGLPSSIEKQFSKIFFAKNVTPLLKIKKIEFALVFAVNQKQLCDILQEVVPNLQKDAKFWIAYPRITSKIASDLCRDNNWTFVSDFGLECIEEEALDNVWTAMQFKSIKNFGKNTAGFSVNAVAQKVKHKKASV